MRPFTHGLVIALALAAGVFLCQKSAADQRDGRGLGPELGVRVKFVSIKVSEYEFLTKQLNRLEATLDRIERSQSWQVQVQNVTRMDREADLKRDACFERCQKTAPFPNWSDKDQPGYDELNTKAKACIEPCQAMPHSPGGGGC
jgi:hypothetical protein